jgi:fructuronate reductase
MTEPFLQWVVEDDFPAGRPDWERFGVEMVTDVTPFEDMKLRLLNGSHSVSPISACCRALRRSSEAFADPADPPLRRGLWAEAIPTLPQGRRT